jgi:hypothetical protein
MGAVRHLPQFVIYYVPKGVDPMNRANWHATPSPAA